MRTKAEPKKVHDTSIATLRDGRQRGSEKTRGQQQSLAVRRPNEDVAPTAPRMANVPKCCDVTRCQQYEPLLLHDEDDESARCYHYICSEKDDRVLANVAFV